jgi:hypothetical protein
MQASARLEVQELVANDLKRGEADQLREIENLRAEIQRWRRFHGMLVECHRAAVDEMMEQGRAGRAVVPPELTGFVDYPCSMLGLSEAEPGDETSSRYDFDVY